MTTTQHIPETMKAMAIDHFGGLEEMHPATVAVPKPSPHDVLIRVDTAGVGVWDPWLVGGGMAGKAPRFPQVLGSDGAGTVVDVGSRVKKLKVGDRVYGWGFGNPKGGFFAEYAAVSEDSAWPIPDALNAEEAGALAVSGITALQGLERIRVREGSTLLIIGASGGVGHVALQLAKRMGARVLAVASGDDGVKLVEKLGADATVEGRKEDVLAAVQAFAPEGLDAALVLAGRADGWQDVLQKVKRGGHVAYPNGVEPVPRSHAGAPARAYDGVNSREAFTRLNAPIGDGPFHVELSRVYRLDETTQALRDVERHHVGKLAIRVH
ncbi:MAG: NADP-dependent oxidoreductase [Myxococcota bacterium]